MASWGHVVFKAEPRMDYQRFCRMHHIHIGFCGRDAGYVKRYTYTTGKAGETATADTWICETHAQAFAARYKIQILDADPGSRQIASQRATNAAVPRPNQFDRTTELLDKAWDNASKEKGRPHDLSADMKRRGYK